MNKTIIKLDKVGFMNVHEKYEYPSNSLGTKQYIIVVKTVSPLFLKFLNQ